MIGNVVIRKVDAVMYVILDRQKNTRTVGNSLVPQIL